jgi:GNAT superfamily N-acetyltransferase
MGMSVTISAATEQDAEQILKLQYLCYQSEAALLNDYGIEPLTQTLDELRAELQQGCVLVAKLGPEVIGTVRGVVDADFTARISRLCVHPRMRRHGLGGRLLARVEERLAAERAAKRYRLFTGGGRSEAGQRLYRRNGYAPVGSEQDVRTRVTLVTMEKEASPQAFAASA